MAFDPHRRWQVSAGIVLVIGLGLALFVWWTNQRREQRVEQIILQAGRTYGVDPALIKAVVWRESRFRAGARGRAGEVGLMQVGRLAAREWAEAERVGPLRTEDLLDPHRNALAGTWYLSKLLKRYPSADVPEAFALADYNAGRSNVLRWNKGPGVTNAAAFLAAMDFPTTRAYVRDVLQQWERYKPHFPPTGL